MLNPLWKMIYLIHLDLIIYYVLLIVSLSSSTYLVSLTRLPVLQIQGPHLLSLHSTQDQVLTHLLICRHGDLAEVN